MAKTGIECFVMGYVGEVSRCLIDKKISQNEIYVNVLIA